VLRRVGSSSVGVGIPASQLHVPAVRIQTLRWPRRDDSRDRVAGRRCHGAKGDGPRQVANRHIGSGAPIRAGSGPEIADLAEPERVRHTIS
jgi:hypothetical protein